MTDKSLRAQFEDKAKVDSEAKALKRAQRTDEQLEKIAGALKKEIQKKIDKGGDELALRVKGISLGELKTLAGYKKLHEICAGDDVDMRIEVGSRRFGNPLSGYYYHSAIIITLNQSYKKSLDGVALGLLPALKKLTAADVLAFLDKKKTGTNPGQKTGVVRPQPRS